MKINSTARAVLIGLMALTLLPVRAWGQAAERVAAQPADLGTTDFRISHIGPDGDANFDALHPAVAYNDADQEFLVVWAGDDRLDGDVEIFGQRLSAATGAFLGGAFRISDMGPEDDPAFDAFTPVVAYNSAEHAYLVVWAGVDGADGQVGLYGQRLDAAGAEVGANDFRISDAPGLHPAVAYNRADNEFLVAWQGAHPRTAGIFGQRLAATGEALGGGAFRISAPAPDDGAAFVAGRPALGYNGDRNEYLVVWEASHPRAAGIFGQRLEATGKALGGSALQLSGASARQPSVAYNPTGGEYLVVWIASEGGLAAGEFEVFAQRVDAATGAEVGHNDFRLSTMGRDGDAAFGAALPSVAYNPLDDEYLVVWRGGMTVEGAHEIYGQRVFGDRSAGNQRGVDDFRISDMGATDADASFDAIQAVVAYGAGSGYLAVWYGDDDDQATDNEHEIFGRRIEPGAPLAIELAEFTARADQDGVALQWTTARTPDNTRFEVQRKTAEVYEVVGEVQAPLTSSAPRQYAYRVAAVPPGRYTFRLKQTDAEGTASFSAEVEIEVEVPGGFSFSAAYPNPFSRSTTLTLMVNERQHVEVAVYDMLGRRAATLYQGEVEALQSHPITFEAAALPSGSYLIRAVGETFAETRKVLLVR